MLIAAIHSPTFFYALALGAILVAIRFGLCLRKTGWRDIGRWLSMDTVMALVGYACLLMAGIIQIRFVICDPRIKLLDEMSVGIFLGGIYIFWQACRKMALHLTKAPADLPA